MDAFYKEDDVHSAVWNRPNQLDIALRSVTYLQWDHINSILLFNIIYTMWEAWTRFAQFPVETNKLSALF